VSSLLRSSTHPRWIEASRSNLGALLSDHLHCERKAAENALSLVRRYAADPAFVDRLTRLAHEETSHLVQVAALMAERGLPVRVDTPNHYARGLLAELRAREPDRRVDALLVAALIEARSHERLSLLARGFHQAGDARLADFYRALANAEERHAELYVELAAEVVGAAVAGARLDELAMREAEILAALPHAPRVH
jgi:tRNA 2-(methylsulfanyl)-N6-isopentenyladenosine37 hydroxylase